MAAMMKTQCGNIWKKIWENSSLQIEILSILIFTLKAWKETKTTNTRISMKKIECWFNFFKFIVFIFSSIQRYREFDKLQRSTKISFTGSWLLEHHWKKCFGYWYWGTMEGNCTSEEKTKVTSFLRLIQIIEFNKVKFNREIALISIAV